MWISHRTGLNLADNLRSVASKLINWKISRPTWKVWNQPWCFLNRQTTWKPKQKPPSVVVQTELQHRLFSIFKSQFKKDENVVTIKCSDNWSHRRDEIKWALEVTVAEVTAVRWLTDFRQPTAVTAQRRGRKIYVCLWAFIDGCGIFWPWWMYCSIAEELYGAIYFKVAQALVWSSKERDIIDQNWMFLTC